MKKINFGMVCHLLLMLTIFSCKKLVDIPLPGQLVTSEATFTTDAGAIAALSGIYSEMASAQNTIFSGGTTLFTGLASDELFNYAPGPRDEFQKNEITKTNHSALETMFWIPAYKQIYAINSCLERVTQSSDISTAVKNIVTGEAKFLRAFTYFNLIQIFGDVPKIVTTDYRVNSTAPRTSVAEIYKLIIDDLKDAEKVLLPTYPTGERIRANKLAASALLARVYLYTQSWTQSETKCTEVINQPQYSLVANVNNVFLKGSTEAIWQYQSVNPQFNTYEGLAFLPLTSSTTPNYLVTAELYNSFETGDARKLAWINSRTYMGQTVYYPYKYKITGANMPFTEYLINIRLAEMYLIRAEARTRTGNFSGALSDLNIIRSRAGLPNSTDSDESSLLSAIEKEKRIELFAEWGHRWFDLKRTGRAAAVLGTLKGNTWQATDVLWPIPINQILINPGLVQNPGY